MTDASRPTDLAATGNVVLLQARRAESDRLIGLFNRLQLLLARAEEIEAEIATLVTTMRLEGIAERDIAALRRAKALGLDSLWHKAVARVMRASRPDARGIVYFIRCRVTGLVKIGFSEKAAARINSIRRQSSTPIETLLMIDGGAAEEAALHLRFAADRDHNEWFRMTAEMAAEIARLRLIGEIDPSPLLTWRSAR